MLYLQGLPVVSRSFADIAFDIDILQKEHRDLEFSVAFARLAAPALYVKAETARLVSPEL